MNPLIDAFSAAWTRCFDYSGRSKRGDYWWFVLANAIISVVLLVLGHVANLFGSIYTIWAVARASFPPCLFWCVVCAISARAGAGSLSAWFP